MEKDRSVRRSWIRFIILLLEGGFFLEDDYGRGNLRFGELVEVGEIIVRRRNYGI